MLLYVWALAIHVLASHFLKLLSSNYANEEVARLIELVPPIRDDQYVVVYILEQPSSCVGSFR